MSPKRSVGVIRGRSDKTDDLSLRDRIVDGEGSHEIVDGEGIPEFPENDPETQIEPREPIIVPVKPKRKPTSRRKKRNDRRKINYFGALDDIIADIYEKQAGAYTIVKAITQMFESRGEEIPFEEERFNKICGNLAEVQAAREIAWLYGLGPEHADKVADLLIERFFGSIKK